MESATPQTNPRRKVPVWVVVLLLVVAMAGGVVALFIHNIHQLMEMTDGGGVIAGERPPKGQ